MNCSVVFSYVKRIVGEALARRREEERGAEPEPVDEPSAPEGDERRKLIVIGDLHGDYYRLVRILREHELVSYENEANPLTFSWSELSEPVDLVLIGDYVDWRGEPLEGPEEEWMFGSYRILLLIRKLREELGDSNLRAKLRFFPLKGNHEDMMMKAFQAYRSLRAKLGEDEFSNLVEVASKNFYLAIAQGISMGMAQEEIAALMDFVNWYFQGGKQTIDSFGGMNRWQEEMSTAIGTLLDDLYLLIKLNSYILAHTLPDDLALLAKALIEGIESLSDEERQRLRTQLLWSRGVWGIDAFSNKLIEPPSTVQLREVLSKVGVERIILGHTPLKGLAGYEDGEPIIAYGGMLVNTDLHGIPMSKPFVEYYTSEGEVMAIEDKALR